LDGFFGTTWAMENGQGIWNLECQKSLKSRFTENSNKMQYNILVRKLERKKSVGRLGRRLEDYIRDCMLEE